MTVAELIKHLETLPQDLNILYSKYSDYDVLEAKDVTVETVSVRAGDYRTFYPAEIYPKGEQIITEDVVTFPGN